MRLAFVCNSLSPATGGVASGTLELAGAMADRGHAVTFITCDDPAAPWVQDPPPAVHLLALGAPNRNVHSYGFIPDLDKRLAGLPRPDMCIINGLWLFATAGFARWAQRQKVPYVLFPHGMLDAYFRRNALRHFKKLCYYALIEHRSLHGAEALLYTASAELAAAQKTFPCFHPRRQAVVGLGLRSSPTPLPAARATFLARFPQLRAKPFLLYLSRFHPKKAPHLLLEALPAYPGLTLVMAGPLEDAAYLRSLRGTLGRHTRAHLRQSRPGARRPGRRLRAGRARYPGGRPHAAFPLRRPHRTGAFGTTRQRSGLLPEAL